MTASAPVILPSQGAVTLSAVAAWTARAVEVACLLLTRGRRAVDALRDAANRWVFHELLDEGLGAPLGAVAARGRAPRGRRTVWTSRENRWRAASPPWKRMPVPGWRSWPPSARRMIKGITALHGRAMGVPNAVLFRAWDFHTPPPIVAEALAAVQDG